MSDLDAWESSCSFFWVFKKFPKSSYEKLVINSKGHDINKKKIKTVSATRKEGRHYTKKHEFFRGFVFEKPLFTA